MLFVFCLPQPQAAAERKRAGGPRKAGSKANLSGMDAGAGEGAGWGRTEDSMQNGARV